MTACHAYGVGIIPWSPTEAGYLAGMLDGGESVRRKNEDLQRRVCKRAPTARGLARPLPDPGRKARLRRPGLSPPPSAVTVPIIGPRTMAQLHASLRALEITPWTPEVLRELDEIFLAGGPSPNLSLQQLPLSS